MARAKMACAKVSLRQSVPAPKCLAPSRPRQVGRAKSAAPNCPRPTFSVLQLLIDSDLVFENLEQTDIASHENHHRIAKDTSKNEENSVDSSPSVDEHWLSSTVNRIKRHINSFLSTNSKVNHAERKGKSSKVPRSRSSPRSKRKTWRVRRQGSQEEADEEYDDEDDGEGAEDDDNTYDEEDEENEETDNQNGEYDDGGDENENEYEEGDLDEDGNGNGENGGNEDEYEDEMEPEKGDEEEGEEEGENGEDDNGDYGNGEYDEHPLQPEIPRPSQTEATFVGVSDIIPPSTEQQETTSVTEIPLIQEPSPTETEVSEDQRGFNLFKPEDNYSSPEARNHTVFGDDDEDNLITSGESSTDGPMRPFPETGVPHPVYYRVSFTVSEPYLPDFADRNSFRYKDFSDELVKEIDNLYAETPGIQTATVIKIEKREADTFTSRVTIDLGSEGYSNKEVMESILLGHITRHHRLGRITVLPEEFNFRAFEESSKVMCGIDQIPCHSGECVSSEARCNGTSECADNSDETGCGDTFVDVPTSASSTISPTTEEEEELGSGCRADDAVRCADGSRVICADQVCDRVKDCDDGRDEAGCPTEPTIACAEGEFSCDLSRCIPVSKRCDGFKDCSDETDERECIVCQSNEIKCDNNCIPPNRLCDGVQDCTNGVDENNCPPPGK
ncbi:hypothetical protein Zmor_014851 [Zophobas morio]|uniref:SEA domain-containing protein n=1 Tax=Zophobas morio TaxID=2755281 RepID=A0AA38MGY8_9CUCU|nr:hypothetical protein Zmor_014851 [Zophobas morio]